MEKNSFVKKFSFFLFTFLIGNNLLLANNNIKNNKGWFFNLCDKQVHILESFNKNKYPDWLKTDVLNDFYTVLEKYEKSIKHIKENYEEGCYLYTIKKNNKDVIIKIEKVLKTNYFVNIPNFLYKKEVEFSNAIIVLDNGKKINVNNFSALQNLIRKYKSKILFLKVFYSSDKISAEVIEIFKEKMPNYLYKFQTKFIIKSKNFDPLKKTPFSVEIPNQSYYIERTKKIHNIDKMRFIKSEPAYNINLK